MRSIVTQFSIFGHVVDLLQRRIFPGHVTVQGDKITSIQEVSQVEETCFILPGFIDAHIHIESSMLIPSEFARIATLHGTVATVSDPHEIANVLGVAGIQFMVNNSKQVPFHFFFGVPSCVPATNFETAGAYIGPEEVRNIFNEYKLHYLSEMMNYPGVLSHDPEILEKIRIAKELNKPIDGHAPGLSGKNVENYIKAGISTDHECSTLEEALYKIKHGMKIIIREGSAAKNYSALHSLFQSHPDKIMLCSDDKHPHELIEGHINLLVKRAVIDDKHDLMDVLYAACIHPNEHYKLGIGRLQVGDPADMIVIKDLKEFKVLQTYVNGTLVADKGRSLIPHIETQPLNKFECNPKRENDFKVPLPFKHENLRMKVIVAQDGELITLQKIVTPKIVNNEVCSDIKNDILKCVLVNRYQDSASAVAFIHGFGLKEGAIASTVAHDSHNLICIGVSDLDICNAVNALIQEKGGIAVSLNGKVETLPLPMAGLMSLGGAENVAQQYVHLDKLSKKLGSPLNAPLMTLSFMALLVIPSLKLSDLGLFDGQSFAFTDLFVMH